MNAPRSSRSVGIGLLIAAFIVAGVLSYFASSRPDGLERVAKDTGISANEGQHATENGPLADYQTRGVEQPWLSGGIAGAIGVIAVAVAATGLFMILRPRRSGSAGNDPASAPAPDEHHVTARN